MYGRQSYSEDLYMWTKMCQISCRCGQGFTTISNMQQHVRVVHDKVQDARRFKCQVCGKAFERKSKLNQHEKSHTGESLYKCEVCGKRLMSLPGFRAHMISHTGAREYTCTICYKSLSTRSNLTTHIKTVHEATKRFQCHLCEASFVRKAHMQRHVKLHEGTRPHACDTCGVTFTRKEHLTGHFKSEEHKSKAKRLRETTTASGWKSYTCLLCIHWLEDKILIPSSHFTLHKLELSTNLL